MLSIRSICKTYPNGVTALNDVSLEIPPGMPTWEEQRGSGGATSGLLGSAVGWARTDLARLYGTFPPPG